MGEGMKWYDRFADSVNFIDKNGKMQDTVDFIDQRTKNEEGNEKSGVSGQESLRETPAAKSDLA